MFFEQGRLAELTGDAGTAAARYRQAYAVYPHPEVDFGAAPRPPRARSLRLGGQIAGFGKIREARLRAAVGRHGVDRSRSRTITVTLARAVRPSSSTTA